MKISDIVGGVLSGNRRSLSRAITLIESDNSEHRVQADELLDLLREHGEKEAFRSVRLGLSGVPGVGKSTFTESLGLLLIERGYKVAVLAVDPSSVSGGGAILADKTRMPKLSANLRAYIRPQPSGLALGGVAARTRDAMLVCEAAGFDRIIIETVGVGQSEVDVSRMCDLFLLLLLPRSGDEFQALKRGIMQLVDIVVVNKADGALKNEAMRTASEYSSALRLMSPRIEGWSVPVMTCSALEGAGIEEIVGVIDSAFEYLLSTRNSSDESLFLRHRCEQNLHWLWSDIRRFLFEDLRANDSVKSHIASIESSVGDGSLLTSRAASDIIAEYFKSKLR